MFSLRKLFTPSTSYCAFRNFRQHVKNPDPGVGRRKKLLALKENEEISDIEDMESDFMAAHQLHRDHEGELANMKEKQKYFIVKQKYFKEKFPNFLTWHDKEQIRYLHRTDPEEWTIEKLTEGFPALPDVIKKIVKSNWTKGNHNQIKNHDTAVQENWKSFKEGEIKELPLDLTEHLNKFTTRGLNITPFTISNSQKNIIDVKTASTKTEFADIITSYQKYKQKAPETEHRQITGEVDQRPHTDTYVAAPINRRRSVTLNQLQVDVAMKIEKGKHVDEEEKYIAAKGVNTQSSKTEEKYNLIDLSKDKYQASTGIQYSQKTERDLSHLNYPDKIAIPKNMFKKGFTYKLYDCYYDDDGEFLYRVPGMG